MSSSGSEGGNPFEGLPMFGDLARLFSRQGPVNWDVARQTAMWLATDGQPEPNVDPLERIRLEELVRVADLRVSATTGLSTSISGGILSILPVTRGDWALHSLEAYRPFLERLATSLSSSGDDADADPSDATAQLLGDLGKMLGPVLLGMQSGFMLGHLARRAFGQYDLPLPRLAADQLLVVPANLDAFGEEWSLAPDDLRLWVCLDEVTHHAVLGRPHVRARLERLINEYVSRFEVDPAALEASLGNLDPTDAAGLQAVLGNPETLLGAMRSPRQQETLTRIETLTAVIEGFVDHVMDTTGHGLIGSYGQLTEALRRRRVEATDGERFAARLLGLELGRSQYERGQAFIRGVVERAGDDGLARLWATERELPTPAELDAPGLWLARIDLPEE
ncbi:MAG TPA: zinc-dependent metalloprotease [Acidimicrobiales bacterium]|nr:zinc-dependent metalloprotease [Acidimicrobiales bacterium]